MKENIKNSKRDFTKPLDIRKEGPAVKPAGYSEYSSKEHGFTNKSNYNDRKNPKGGCGCS